MDFLRELSKISNSEETPAECSSVINAFVGVSSSLLNDGFGEDSLRSVLNAVYSASILHGDSYASFIRSLGANESVRGLAGYLRLLESARINKWYVSVYVDQIVGSAGA